MRGGSGHARFVCTNCAFVLDEREKKRMEHTFEMCYVLASKVSIVPYSSGGTGC